MIIILDGPEKSGKSTLIERVRQDLECVGYDVRLRKWGQLVIDDREYAEPLMRDTESYSNVVTIWDRSWASEHVYAKMLNRDRRLKDNPLLGELLHRRALFGQGMAFMLAPAVEDGAVSRRDSSDLSVDPLLERKEFINYALKYRWFGMLNAYTDESLAKNARTIVNAVTKKIAGAVHNQRYLVVPSVERSVLFVGNQNIDDPIPGGWLPFSSDRMLRFVSLFGQYSLMASYADANFLNDQNVAGYKYIITTDMTSDHVIGKLKTTGAKVFNYVIPVEGGQYSIPGRNEAIENMKPGMWWLNNVLKGIYNATNYL
jgi:hypothetical protein